MATATAVDVNLDREGYPVEIFKNHHSVDEKFLCNICHKIIRDPVQSFCGHRFCKSCVHRISSSGDVERCQKCEKEGAEEEYSILKMDQMFPDNAVRREMSKLPVTCIYEGCSWTGNFRDYELHSDACTYRPVTCDACQQPVAQLVLDEHKKTLCPARPVKCKFCALEFAAAEQQQHDDSDCPKKPVKCNSCGLTGTQENPLTREKSKFGPCKTTKPGFFDFQGKAKWDAWNKLGNKEKAEAMHEYIAEVTRVKPDWESQIQGVETAPGKSLREGYLGVAVSTMVNPDNHLDDELKTVFDWCKEGNILQVNRLLRSGFNVDETDNEGMALLHWACDRGDVDMVRTLLKHKALVDIQDADAQTPLHFAVICEHPHVVKVLLDHKAKTDLYDVDGQTVLQLETTSEIQEILASYPAG